MAPHQRQYTPTMWEKWWNDFVKNYTANVVLDQYITHKQTVKLSQTI